MHCHQSRQKVTCSLHDVAKQLLTWHQTAITQ